MVNTARKCLLARGNRGITHGFMLKRSFPACGVGDTGANPLSAQAGEVGPVGLVGEEAFLLWISCTCFGSETATD